MRQHNESIPCVTETVSKVELITSLKLVRHPEGGWYRETYRSAENVPADALPERFGGLRACCTAIYFLLEQGDVSTLHRIKSDELWCFHAGTTLTIHILSTDGSHTEIRLGSNMTAGEVFQATVPAGAWFGAEISGAGRYALVSCMVSPGFDFADFEMGDRTELLQCYPDHEDSINRLTRPNR